MARATSSFPVALWREISTEIDYGATRSINSAMRHIAVVCPITGVRWQTLSEGQQRRAA
jgi:hypothetical protein